MRRAPRVSLVSFLVACGLGACGEETTAPGSDVASVTVTPRSATIYLHRPETLEATVRDTTGSVLSRAVTWSTGDAHVATISPQGVVTGVALGATTIRAEVDGVADSATVNVEAWTVARIAVTPADTLLLRGLALPLTLELYDADDSLITNHAVQWTSSDTSIATVDTLGRVEGIEDGVATIVARTEGIAATSTVTVRALRFKTVHAGMGYTCGLTDDGEIFCWGSNQHRQLGLGVSFMKSNVPLRVVLPEGPAWSGLTVGDGHACAWSDSATYCWGSWASEGLPAVVQSAPGFTAVAAGSHLTCGVDGDGGAWCWGSSWYGEGGFGQGDAVTPLRVYPSLAFSTIDPGDYHSCGITTWGAAYCWGVAWDGALGNGRTSDYTGDAQLVSGGLHFESVRAGSFHTCGLTTDAALYCWGNDEYGQLGTDTPNVICQGGICRSTPTRTAGGPYTSFSVGQVSSCAIATDGVAYCWGANGSGQLGTGNTDSADLPTPVTGSHHWRDISIGAQHACGITTEGLLYCWGSHRSGQLGIGETLGEGGPSPLRVVGQ